MQEPQNVDSLLFSHPTQNKARDISQPVVPELTHTEDRIQDYSPEDNVSRETINPESVEQLTSDSSEGDVPRETLQESNETETNDYGIEVTKKPEKTYTQAEVNEMIRDRLSRGKFAEKHAAPEPQYTPQQQQIGQDFQVDPNNTDSWEVQLDQYINHSIDKRERSIKEHQWQQQAQIDQAQFEVKFNSGASKYADFEQVVMGKSLTPQMVMATRGMNDPASFIYAAAKTQEAELSRIASLHDPMIQAVELGKLEERMRKARPLSSSAPKPISYSVGDTAERTPEKGDLDVPIDQRIAQDAVYRNNRRMGR